MKRGIEMSIFENYNEMISHCKHDKNKSFKNKIFLENELSLWSDYYYEMIINYYDNDIDSDEIDLILYNNVIIKEEIYKTIITEQKKYYKDMDICMIKKIEIDSKDIRLKFYNDDELGDFVSNFFDETGTKIVNGKLDFTENMNKSFYNIVKDLDNYKLRFESDKIKGVMDLNIKTNSDFITITCSNSYMMMSKKQKYNFF